MKDKADTRLADLLRMPLGERRVALRGLVSRSSGGSALRRDLKLATTIGAQNPTGEQLATGWQDRVLTRLRETESALESEGQAARDLVAKVLELPRQRRETLVRNSKRFHNWSFCQQLSKESVRALFRDPQEGLEIALLATDIAEGPHLTAASETLLNDLKALCWSYLGNAHRALSQHNEAEVAFTKATGYLRRGTGDPVDQARLADFRATLRLRQRRFPEAEKLFDQAIRVFLSVGDRHMAGVSVVGKAILRLETGAVEDSMLLNRQALEMLDLERDTRLPNFARHNLAVALKTLGAFAEASEEIRKLKSAYAALGDTVALLRLGYLEAEVDFGMGIADRAIARLSDVREAYAGLGLVLDVAFATLDLAGYHLELNQLAETKRLASESLPLFRSLGIHREAIAAFLVFQEAAEREVATVELVREIATYLRASRTNPELKFRA